jgi:kynurenine formamidase
VIDCSEQAKADPDYLLTVDDIERFEAAHGRIGGRLVGCDQRTDWSQAAPATPRRTRTSTRPAMHTPGALDRCGALLVDERRVLGFGSEAIGTDAGQGYHLRPPYPCHYYMHAPAAMGCSA